MRVPALALALIVPAVAVAAPPAAGTWIRVDGVSPKDAYFPSRKDIVGLVCEVGDADLASSKGRWVSGRVWCDGDEYYFYQAKVVAVPAPVRDTSLRSSPTQRAPIGAGEVVTIVRVAEDDAFHGSRASIEGRLCRTNGSPSFDGTWYTGSVSCDADTYYFYHVALERPTGGGVAVVAPATDAARTAEPPSDLAAGVTFTVVDVSEEDAYRSRRDEIVGLSCVSTGPLTARPGGWYTGPATCGDETYYFFEVSIR